MAAQQQEEKRTFVCAGLVLLDARNTHNELVKQQQTHTQDRARAVLTSNCFPPPLPALWKIQKGKRGAGAPRVSSFFLFRSLPRSLAPPPHCRLQKRNDYICKSLNTLFVPPITHTPFIILSPPACVEMCKKKRA
jgi:hypothetical protein